MFGRACKQCAAFSGGATQNGTSATFRNIIFIATRHNPTISRPKFIAYSELCAEYFHRCLSVKTVLIIESNTLFVNIQAEHTDRRNVAIAPHSSRLKKCGKVTQTKANRVNFNRALSLQLNSREACSFTFMESSQSLAHCLAFIVVIY